MGVVVGDYDNQTKNYTIQSVKFLPEARALPPNMKDTSKPIMKLSFIFFKTDKKMKPRWRFEGSNLCWRQEEKQPQRINC